MEVQDTGVGISQDEMPNLFRMFGKLHRTAEQNSDGLGMGLLICKSLVQANSGTIEAFSAGKGMGSTFKFTMAMDEVKEDDLGGFE